MINELANLIDPTQQNPALPANHPFNNVRVQQGWYWSSTTSSNNPSEAYFMDMSNGEKYSFDKRGYLGLAWCVREDNVCSNWNWVTISKNTEPPWWEKQPYGDSVFYRQGERRKVDAMMQDQFRCSWLTSFESKNPFEVVEFSRFSIPSTPEILSSCTLFADWGYKLE